MFFNLYAHYSYSSVYVSCLTIVSFFISIMFKPSYETLYDNHYITHIHNEFVSRLQLAIPQFFIHYFFLIPARTNSNYARYFPRTLFYPALFVCNIMLAMHVRKLFDSIAHQWYYGMHRDTLRLTYLCDIIILCIWTSVLISRVLSYMFCTTDTWFKLAWMDENDDPNERLG
jgi:hypothetical protein